jgi:hypothetical protein
VIDANRSAHSLDTLTDAQLRDYRRELEHSLKVISPDAPVRSLLADKLFGVLGEQASRSCPEEPAMPRGEEEFVSNS